MTRLPSTHWFLVERAGGTDPTSKQQAVSSLLNLYWAPLFVYLRQKRGWDHRRAEEALQAFIASVLLQYDWLQRAHAEKRQFRSWLRLSVDQHASQTFGDDTGPHAVETTFTPDELFERVWALEVLGDLLRRLRFDCVEKEKPKRWDLFVAHTLGPALDRTAVPGPDDLAESLGGVTGHEVECELEVIRRQCGVRLRAMIEEFVVPTVDVGQRLDEIYKHALSQVKAGMTPDVIEQTARHRLQDWINRLVVKEVEYLKQVLAPRSTNGHSGRPASTTLREFIRRRLDNEAALGKRATDLLDIATSLTSEDEVIIGGLMRLLEPVPAVHKSPSVELEDVLQQLLINPLPTPAARIALESPRGSSLLCLADLLEHPHPPLKVLRLTKEWARDCRNAASGGWPAQIATAIYYACIASSIVYTDRVLTNLENNALIEGLSWGMGQPWMDTQIRNLLAEARGVLVRKHL